ncbi:MAG: carboxysome peptide A [Cyanobacteriota bacterium]|nr:carboxysome peptide A [Cyanobacteriota bacterium]
MIICKVVKPLVSTNRIPDFEHKYLQVVLDGSTQKVAVDAVGAMPGDWVICVGSSAAREAAGSKSYPSDLTIVGIIDHWDPEEATAIAKGSASASSASPSAGSSASSSASSSSASASSSGGSGNGGPTSTGGTG